MIDESSSRLLNISGKLPLPVEINERRANVWDKRQDSAHSWGPYVFTSYADGARYAGLRPAETMFILVRLQPGAAIEEVKRELKGRLPNADVWTGRSSARKSQLYWTSQTGAGAPFSRRRSWASVLDWRWFPKPSMPQPWNGSRSLLRSRLSARATGLSCG